MAITAPFSSKPQLRDCFIRNKVNKGAGGGKMGGLHLLNVTATTTGRLSLGTVETLNSTWLWHIPLNSIPGIEQECHSLSLNSKASKRSVICYITKSKSEWEH